jgi:hypothetical protein
MPKPHQRNPKLLKGPAPFLKGIGLNHKTPSEILPYNKNCAAMTFSRVLGIGVHATIHYLVGKGWISKGTQLEQDSVILYVLGCLGLAEQYRDEEWRTVQVNLAALQDGRYFAMNYGPNGSTAKDAMGHAFAIVKNGGWAVYGNNSEQPARPYRDAIHPTHKISVYGPRT